MGGGTFILLVADYAFPLLYFVLLEEIFTLVVRPLVTFEEGPVSVRGGSSIKISLVMNRFTLAVPYFASTS